MAREYGDHTTARRLGKKLAQQENARFFDSDRRRRRWTSTATSSATASRYPRGQESALYMLKDLLDGEGEWGRAFNEPDTEKFSAPTVTDVAYPKMGFSVAWNDPPRGVLRLESYAATTSARGDATRFTVAQAARPARRERAARRSHLRRLAR